MKTKHLTEELVYAYAITNAEGDYYNPRIKEWGLLCDPAMVGTVSGAKTLLPEAYAIADDSSDVQIVQIVIRPIVVLY